MFTSIIYVGEESGALDEILEKTADYYEEEADAAVTRLVGLMEPLLIVFMGVAIGLCLAGIFPLLYFIVRSGKLRVCILCSLILNISSPLKRRGKIFVLKNNLRGEGINAII